MFYGVSLEEFFPGHARPVVASRSRRYLSLCTLLINERMSNYAVFKVSGGDKGSKAQGRRYKLAKHFKSED